MVVLRAVVNLRLALLQPTYGCDKVKWDCHPVRLPYLGSILP